MAKRGIDISSHQGNIDLATLKNDIDFVIIRVGYGTKGTIDAKFTRNADLCRNLGIPVGFYWYSYALDVDGAEREANAFVNAIAPYKDICHFGAWFDMEDADSYKRKNGMPSNDTLKEMCYKFCDIVENAGFYTGIYASLSWFNNQLAGDRLNRFDKWVAQWPTSGGKQTALNTDPNSRSQYSLWQFTSEGKFNGYNGNLDTNYAYRDFPNPGSQPEPTPEPQPAPAPTKSIDELAQEVINGQWGNGEDRKNALINAGYDYNAVQNKVNEMLAPKPAPITKGCRVKFTGTRSYSGIHLASWTHGDIFNVIEVSGDRIVIGKGSAVTAAVNIRDCQRV